jgi:sec-independent protein translocase protein TatC
MKRFRKRAFYVKLILFEIGSGFVEINRKEIFASIGRLRRGILFFLIVFVVFFIVAFIFSKPLMRHLRDTSLQIDLVAFGIPEAFLSMIKLSIFASLFFTVPIIFYQIAQAFAPLFRKRDFKGSSSSVLVTAVFLFYLGAFFCYFITLPFGVKFLLGYQSAHIKPMISVGRYISFCSVFIFGFGLTFELPLILALLSMLKVVTAKFLTKNRRYAILVIAILAAVVTPTPDVFNMSLMGGPLYLLFEIGILLVKMIERKRIRAEALLPQGSMER